MSFPWAEHYTPKHPVMQWMDEKLPLPRLVYNAVGAGYPVPRNLNYFWNFGVLAGLALVIQIVTGIIMAMHYGANDLVAFATVEQTMRDVNSGWLMRYAHANGASFFFIVVYLHIFRGLFYGSYKAPREMVWLLGLVIFLLMMATAFMGYVLPWGQMSYWGAKVITGLFGAIPVVGEPIQTWLLGGFAPGNASLNRFFSLHFLLPFVIAGVVILHIWALHIPGSSNPTGVEVKSESDTVPFHPYYTMKDTFGILVFLIFFAIAVSVPLKAANASDGDSAFVDMLLTVLMLSPMVVGLAGDSDTQRIAGVASAMVKAGAFADNDDLSLSCGAAGLLYVLLYPQPGAVPSADDAGAFSALLELHGKTERQPPPELCPQLGAVLVPLVFLEVVYDAFAEGPFFCVAGGMQEHRVRALPWPR